MSAPVTVMALATPKPPATVSRMDEGMAARHCDTVSTPVIRYANRHTSAVVDSGNTSMLQGRGRGRQSKGLSVSCIDGSTGTAHRTGKAVIWEVAGRGVVRCRMQKTTHDVRIDFDTGFPVVNIPLDQECQPPYLLSTISAMKMPNDMKSASGSRRGSVTLRSYKSKARHTRFTIG